MSASRVSVRVRRGAVAVLSLSLAAAGMAGSAPGAEAVSTSIAYSCNSGSSSPFTLAVVLDTSAPARMIVGQSTQVIVTASATLPAAQAQAASSAGAKQFDGSWVLKATLGAAAVDVTQNITPAQLNGGTTAVPFTATSAAFTYVAPSTPGVIEVSAADLTQGMLRFSDGATPVTSTPITCTVPPGKAPVIDTIAVVVPTTTTLTLDKTTSEFGQDVTATARVTSSSGIPDGDVAFTVDGLATKAKVGKDGIATLVLPDAATGFHSVSATFTPRDLGAFLGSQSAAQAWEVNRARTRIKVPVTGRTTTVATSVGVKAKGVFGSVPAGKVRIKLKRIGKPGKWAKVRTLDDTGAAKAGFGRLAKGRYQVVVVYRGDPDHLGLKKTKKFRVTRG